MRTRTILAALASFTVIGAAANADPGHGQAFTWGGGTNANWNNAANWSPNDHGYPGEDAGDSVTIPDVTNDPVLNVSPANQLTSMTINASGKLTVGDGFSGYILGVSGTTTLNGELVVTSPSQFDADGAFAINNGSTLNIQSGGIFDVGGTTTYNAGTLTIGGTLRLSDDGLFNADADCSLGSGATLDVKNGGTFDIGAATFTYNAGTFNANGSVRLSTSTSTLDVQGDLTFGVSGIHSTSFGLFLQHDDSRILILADKTFTNPSGFTLQGNGKVTGLQVDADLPMFTNSGTVIADRTGVLLFDTKVEITGSSSVKFQVTNANATLRMARDTAGIIGDFDVQSGILDINATVQADNLDIDCGATVDASGGSFSHQSTTGSGACDPEIPSPITTNFTCSGC